MGIVPITITLPKPPKVIQPPRKMERSLQLITLRPCANPTFEPKTLFIPIVIT